MTEGPVDGEHEAPVDGPLERLSRLGLDLPEHGTGARAARRARRPASPEPRSVQIQSTVTTPPTPDPRRWSVVIATALVIGTLAAGALVYLGLDTLRDSRAGRTVVSADPDEPGFEGFLEPTPTIAVLHGRPGQLDAVAVLALGADDRGGSVVIIPAATLVGDGQSGTIAVGYTFGSSPDELRSSVELVVGAGVQEVAVLDDDRWAELVAPVAPLPIDNPERIEGFPVGDLELEADEVGEWVAAVDDDEDESARLYRQELLWRAWIERVAASGSDAVPGELDSGLGRYIRGLAAGPVEIFTLPVTATDEDTFEVDRDRAMEVVAEAIAFPVGTASAPRPQVRLLDGTGDRDHVPVVAPEVVRAGAAIVVVGNADHFDYRTTEIRYHRPEHRTAALSLRRGLGTGEVIEDTRPIDSFDVTIVLGTDI